VGHNVILHGCTVERGASSEWVIILNGAGDWIGFHLARHPDPEKTIVDPTPLDGSPGKFHRRLEEKDEETILRYAENYLGYKESYLMERKGS